MKKIRQKISDSHLRSKLLATYILFIILPVIILVLVTNYNIQVTMVKQSSNAYTDMLRQINTNVSYYLEDAVDIGNRIQDDDKFIEYYRARSNGQLTLDREIESFYQTISKINIYEETPNVSKISLYAYGQPGLLETNDRYRSAQMIESEPALKKLTSKETYAMWVYAEDLRKIPVSNSKSILYVRAIQHPGTYRSTIGYIMIEMDTNFIWKIMNQIQVTPEAHYVVSNEKHVIMTSFPEELRPDLTRCIRSMRPSDDDMTTHTVGGKEYHIIAEPLSNLQWNVSMMITNSDLAQNAIFLRNVTLGIAVGLVIFSVFLAVRISGSVTRKLNQLMKTIEATAKGVFSTMQDIEGNDEFSKLQKSFNQMIIQIETLIQDVYQAQIDRKKAEMDLLYAQINPHFLYNTLDIIKWSAIRSGNIELSHVTESLAKYLRLRLNNGQEMITVEQEVEQIYHYVEIMNYRYKNSIQLTVAMDSNTSKTQIIKMLLQPVLENAIVHGIMETDQKRGKISIRSYIEDDFLIFRIEDDGVGMTQEQMKNIINQDSKGGYGIKNVYQRIKTYYGEQSGIFYTARKGGGCCVKIKLFKGHSKQKITGDSNS